MTAGGIAMTMHPLATLFIAAITSSTALAGEPSYELFIIEPFASGSTAEAMAFAVNDAGIATGYATDPNVRPYVWDVKSGKRDLGSPSPSGSSTGRDVNAAGAVAGWANSVAAIWFDVNDFQLLPAPAGAFFPFANGLNDANIVVGKANLSANITTGFVWDAANGSRDLRTLGVPNAWNAVRINNNNQAIGQRLDGNFIAYRFSLDTAALNTLGTLGGPQSEALGVNNQGDVVGWANNANFNIRAFIWTETAGMQDLGSLGGQPYDWARAYDINDDDVIVGASDNAAGQARSFIWDSAHGMRDLNTLIDAPEFRLESAQRISNTGWIAGGGRPTAGGLPRGFVLKPIGPACLASDITCDGAVGIDDLLMVINGWGACQGVCAADVTGDGMVNIDDLLMVINNWG
jgi:probable HAF family extracellular repeat protein